MEERLDCVDEQRVAERTSTEVLARLSTGDFLEEHEDRATVGLAGALRRGKIASPSDGAEFGRKGRLLSEDGGREQAEDEWGA